MSSDNGLFNLNNFKGTFKIKLSLLEYLFSKNHPATGIISIPLKTMTQGRNYKHAHGLSQIQVSLSILHLLCPCQSIDTVFLTLSFGIVFQSPMPLYFTSAWDIPRQLILSLWLTPGAIQTTMPHVKGRFYLICRVSLTKRHH